MSTEIVTTSDDITTEIVLEESSTSTPSTIWNNGSELTSTVAFGSEFPTTESANFTSDDKQQSEATLSVFEAFIIIEIVMTALELNLSILAASKVERWRRNYRNQMLMQLSLVRFIKRVFSLIDFYKENNKIQDSAPLSTLLISSHIYIDFVIVVLVFFFIKHMYDSLIVVLVKIRQNNLIKVSLCSWLLPLTISSVCTALILNDVLEEWSVYLIVCCAFRWPMMLLGTMLYILILYRVLKDKIRRFATSLAIITFLLCLVINLYLFSKDVIYLWCIHSFLTLLVSYVLGLILNFLILCLYIILLILNFKCNTKSCNSLPEEVYQTQCS